MAKAFSRIPMLLLLLVVAATFVFPSVPQVKEPAELNPADTAWMLSATALVLIMTPGLAFFYGEIGRAHV